jgi:hypothetical protein
VPAAPRTGPWSGASPAYSNATTPPERPRVTSALISRGCDRRASRRIDTPHARPDGLTLAASAWLASAHR